MTYVYNDPSEFKDDALKGFAAAYPQYVSRVEGASGFTPGGRTAGGEGQPGHWWRLGALPVVQRRRGYRIR